MTTLSWIDAAAVHQAGDFRALVDHFKRQHLQPMVAVDKLLMQQPAAHDLGTDAFLIWPAWESHKHMGIKVVTLFPGNPTLPTVQAVYLLFDATNGQPLCMIDGTALTYWKTAADSALACDLLANPNPQSLLMVGAGAMAPYLIRAHLAVRPSLRQIRVWNRTQGRAEALVATLRPQLPAHIDLAICPDLAQAVPDANIVSVATASTTPVLLGQWVRPGTHVDLIGAYTPHMREADSALVRQSDVFVDSRNFTVSTTGDLALPIANGEISTDHILGDLFELCQGQVKGRRSPQAVTLFKSGGGAHLDLMAAQYFYAKAQQHPAPNPSTTTSGKMARDQ